MLKYFVRKVKHLIVDRSANVAIIFGLTLVPIAGAAASAVDFSRFYDTQSSAQEVLDASLLAGVSSNSDKDLQITIARKFFNAQIEPNIRAKNLTFWYNSDILEGSVSVTYPTAMLKIIGYKELNGLVTGGATLTSVGSQLRCIHTLDPYSSMALTLNAKPRTSDVYKGASLTANGCTVQVNSSSPPAAMLKAGEFSSGGNCFVGGYIGDSTKLSPPPQPKCTPIGDPFAGYSMATPNTCDFSAETYSSSGKLVLKPGTYCGGIDASAIDIQFEPGTYILRSGGLHLNADSNVTGNGVSFIIEEDGDGFSIDANAVSLKASSQGPAASFIIFDRSGSGTVANGKSSKKGKKGGGKKHKSKGKGNVIRAEEYVYLEGITYSPNAHLELRWRRPGTLNSPYWNAPNSPFSSFIANTLDFHGYSQLVFDYDPEKTDLKIPSQLLGSKQYPRLTH